MVDKILGKLWIKEIVSVDITDESFSQEVEDYWVTALPHTVFVWEEKHHVVGTLDYSEYKKAHDGIRGDAKEWA